MREESAEFASREERERGTHEAEMPSANEIVSHSVGVCTVNVSGLSHRPVVM